MSAVLDTHTAIWYLLESAVLPASVYSFIDRAISDGTPTFISAVSLIEVVYLVERGRIAQGAFGKFEKELDGSNPAFAVVSVAAT